MRALLGLVAFVSAPAIAQGVVVSGPSDVAAALAAAQSAQQQAAAANSTASAASTAANNALAAVPPICTSTPSKDTLNGSVGSASACTPLGDNTRPTAVQAGNTILAANCTFTISFARAFTSATPFVYAAVVDSSGNQMPCKIQTRTTQVETGVCAPANATAA